MKKLVRTGPRFKGLTVGLDVHKKFIEYAVLNRRGDQVEGGRVESRGEALRKKVHEWQARGPVQGVLEACGCFVWIFDLLVEELGRAQVHVAQPGKMEVIGKSQEKDDASDAWWLAYELYERRLPEAFVAEGQLRELRIAVRELRWCTDARSDQLRRFLSHWAQMGGQVSRGWHVSKAKRAPVREMVKQVQGERGRALRRLYNMILRQTREMRYWRRRVEELSRGFSEIAKMEEQMPGLGLVTASAVYAELGPAQRFKSAKAYAKATGLTPGYRITAGKVRGRVITKAGSRLARWALTRSALSCLRCRQGSGAQVKYWMVKRMKSKPRKKVLVAVARKLGEGIWRLFNFAEGFQLEKAFPVRGPREGQAEKEPRRVFVLTDRRLEGPAQGRGVASPRGVGQCLEPGQLPTVATAAARPVS